MRAAKTPHGGVKTPPYGKREHGSSDRRSQQDKIARAACRPPLRPNGNSQFSIFVRNLRKVVGRGLDPAAGTSRQARRFHNKPPGFPIDVGAACTPPGNVVVARDLPGSENTPRRGTTPPYRVTGNGRPSRKTAYHPQTPRAACRPPLRSAGMCTAKTCCFRRFVGRGRTPPQEPPGRRGVFNKPPGFPIDVGAACTPPGNVAVARNVPGHANLHGGVRPRPTE